MENKYWRWIGYFSLLIVFFGMGYSYGFVNGGEKTFDFFMNFVDYSVERGILTVDVNASQLEEYLKLAQMYCYKVKNGGSGSLEAGLIDC